MLSTLLERGVFITGTDTGVGKTAVTAALALVLQARGRRVAPFKPVQTGWAANLTGDADFVLRVLGSDEPSAAVCPYRFALPAAPTVAARGEGAAIAIERIIAAYRALLERYETVLVEGAGGLLVEVSEGFTMADLAARLALPLLIVARPGLGTLNHTALTVAAAQAHGLVVLGVAICGFPAAPGPVERTNPAELVRITGVPLLGVLPFDAALDTEAGRPGALAHTAAASLAPELGGQFDAVRFLASLEASAAPG